MKLSFGYWLFFSKTNLIFLNRIPSYFLDVWNRLGLEVLLIIFNEKNSLDFIVFELDVGAGCLIISLNWTTEFTGFLLGFSLDFHFIAIDGFVAKGA